MVERLKRKRPEREVREYYRPPLWSQVSRFTYVPAVLAALFVIIIELGMHNYLERRWPEPQTLVLMILVALMIHQIVVALALTDEVRDAHLHRRLLEESGTFRSRIESILASYSQQVFEQMPMKAIRDQLDSDLSRFNDHIKRVRQKSFDTRPDSWRSLDSALFWESASEVQATSRGNLLAFWTSTEGKKYRQDNISRATGGGGAARLRIERIFILSLKDRSDRQLMELMRQIIVEQVQAGINVFICKEEWLVEYPKLRADFAIFGSKIASHTRMYPETTNITWDADDVAEWKRCFAALRDMSEPVDGEAALHSLLQ